MFPNAFVKNLQRSPRRNYQKSYIFFSPWLLRHASLFVEWQVWKMAGRHLLSTTPIRVAMIKICRERSSYTAKACLYKKQTAEYILIWRDDARMRDTSLQPSSGFSSEHRGSSTKLLLWPYMIRFFVTNIIYISQVQ